MNEAETYIEDGMTFDELEAFEEKFCRGTIKMAPLTDEEIEQLKKEGRL